MRSIFCWQPTPCSCPARGPEGLESRLQPVMEQGLESRLQPVMQQEASKRNRLRAGFQPIEKRASPQRSSETSVVSHASPWPVISPVRRCRPSILRSCLSCSRSAAGWRVRRSADRRTTIKTVALFVAACGVGCGLWFAKNWVLTGNPAYPLMYDIFGGKTWTPEKNALWNQVHRPHDFSLGA